MDRREWMGAALGTALQAAPMALAAAAGAVMLGAAAVGTVGSMALGLLVVPPALHGTANLLVAGAPTAWRLLAQKD